VQRGVGSGVVYAPILVVVASSCASAG
jgi:hypothetical protein